MSKHCQECGGRFGLTRRRWGWHQFCSMPCLVRYRDRVYQEVRRRKWLAFLSG